MSTAVKHVTTKSDAVMKEAATLMPGGVSSPVRAFKSVEAASSSTASRAPTHASTGTSTSIMSGPGAGHLRPREHGSTALRAALEKGTSFGAPSENENVLAKMSATPCRRWRWCASRTRGPRRAWVCWWSGPRAGRRSSSSRAATTATPTGFWSRRVRRRPRPARLARRAAGRDADIAVEYNNLASVEALLKEHSAPPSPRARRRQQRLHPADPGVPRGPER